MTSLYANIFNLESYPIILVVALLLFGAKRLPEMARSMGQSVKEFKKGINEIQDDVTSEPSPAPRPEAPAASDAAPRA
ncbi:MAG TPA: twin-arginine translocase TatA/TatE family subunit [Armatimonadota bacterium]|jgi:sec-independent protein translocase protein TatA